MKMKADPIPTKAPTASPPTAVPTVTPMGGLLDDLLWSERHVVGPFSPLCSGPLAQELPAASTTDMKNGAAHDKLTVQFILLISLLVML